MNEAKFIELLQNLKLKKYRGPGNYDYAVCLIPIAKALGRDPMEFCQAVVKRLWPH